MFDVFCPECSSRRLIFPGQVDRVVNDDGGIVVHFSCWCGAPGAWRTGRRAGHDALTWARPALAC
ncbi:MAG: hypothetical protein ACRDV1_06800 [Actinomycetes bacterium]